MKEPTPLTVSLKEMCHCLNVSLPSGYQIPKMQKFKKGNPDWHLRLFMNDTVEADTHPHNRIYLFQRTVLWMVMQLRGSLVFLRAVSRTSRI